MAFEWDNDNPLARCKGETAKANAALHDYAAMGAGRSLRKLYAIYRQQLDNGAATKPPTSRERTIGGWSEQFQWQARIARYDEIEREAEFAALREEAIEDRRRRIATLRAYRGHIVKALDALDPNDARHADVTAALRMVTDELRIEYGDDVKKHEISGTIEARTVELDGLTDEELAALAAIARRAASDTD